MIWLASGSSPRLNRDTVAEIAELDMAVMCRSWSASNWTSSSFCDFKTIKKKCPIWNTLMNFPRFTFKRFSSCFFNPFYLLSPLREWQMCEENDKNFQGFLLRRIATDNMRLSGWFTNIYFFISLSWRRKIISFCSWSTSLL